MENLIMIAVMLISTALIATLFLVDFNHNTNTNNKIIEEDIDDFTNEEIEQMESDFNNKVNNYNTNVDINYVYDNNEVIAIKNIKL